MRVVVRGAQVYPGDGPPLRADVAFDRGLVAAVGERLEADEVVDGTGALLCPGFIDLHAHSALASWDDPLLTPKILQGFTTEVVQPDGLAPAPVADVERRRAYLRALEGDGPPEWPWRTFAAYLDALDATRPATTLVPSAPHGAIRDLVVGAERRPATLAELDEMRRQVRLALEAGARSLSFGLVYLPGAYADAAELDAVAAVAGEAGVPLVPHVRNEGLGVLEAVEELIGVAVRAGAPLHLSHLKCLADEALVEPLLALVESVEGEISFDQYPYGAGCTLLAGLLPQWAQEGGADATLARVGDRRLRERIRRDVTEGLPGWENQLGTLGPERVHVDGLPLAAHADGADPVDTVCDLLLETGLAATVVLHYAGEEAVRAVAAHPLQLVGSDGIFGAHPHPRLHGTAPRFLGRFVLRDGLLPLEEGIARLTARAAARFGLHDRGRLAVGLRADAVLLDPDAFVDTATFEEPRRSPPGVRAVWVAGEAVVRDGRPTGARPGGVLRS
ncbi:MAG TPA: amidohydrolase family protein [Gaiellaceae bacterium]|nr:amidohydrolase family protein [Gaiellaceae bacterium]